MAKKAARNPRPATDLAEAAERGVRRVLGTSRGASRRKVLGRKKAAKKARSG